MKRPLILVSLIYTLCLTSCSQKGLLKIITSTPKIEYKSIDDFAPFSDYHKDAIYTVQVVKETYPRLYQKIPDFDTNANSFISSASVIMSEKQFDIALKKFIALLKDGHSSFSIEYSKYDKTYYSIYLFKERENWIIGNIDRDVDSTVIGKKIVSINDIDIAEIERRINAFESGENKYWTLTQGANSCIYPTFWDAIHITTPENHLLKFVVGEQEQFSSFTLKAKKKREYYKVKTKGRKYPFRFKQNGGFYDTISKDQNFAYLQMNTSLDYVSIKSEIKNYTTFLTRPIALSFLKKDKKDALNFGEFLQSFFERVQSKKVDKLIIDLSYNTGGDERTGKQLIWYLTEDHPKGFTEYIQNSDYFKKQIKVDARKYNEMHKKKYNTDLPRGEVNITEKLFDEPYFTSITKIGSPFLLDETIPKFTGTVYVITGPKTFSAGQWLATTLADNGLATIIGTPTGNQPSCQTGASMFKLPNTKKIVTISYIFAERPDKSKNHEIALFPEIEIHKTYPDLINGDDRIMEYIINH